VATSKACVDGLGEDSTDSDMDEDENDEARLLEVEAAVDSCALKATGAVELPPHLPSRSLLLAVVNRLKWKARSAESGHLVPLRIAQRERANLMRARRNAEDKVHYVAGPRCPFFFVGRSPEVEIVVQKANVELEDGVVPAGVATWRCLKCLFRV